MGLFATRWHSQSERRRTLRLRHVLGLAAAGCVVSALLTTPALADSSPAVDNTVAATVEAVDNTLQSTSGGTVTPPATPTPSQDAAPAPATSEPSPAADASQVAPPERDVSTTSSGSGSESEVTNGASDPVSKTISGAADTVRKALPESVGKTASDLTETVGKATGGSLDLPAIPALPKLTIAPILPANPILPLLPNLSIPGPDLPGILGTADDLLGLNLRSTVSLVTAPVADVLGATELTAPLSEILGVAGKGSPPGAPPAQSSLGGHGASLDQPFAPQALTGPTSLSAIHEAARAPSSQDFAVPRNAPITPSMSSATTPSAEPVAPGNSPNHGPLPGPGTTSAAAPSGLLLIGFAAMLLVALAAAAPAIRRLIQTAPACWRPAPFVALLERPG
jgi:hypothetical protein